MARETRSLLNWNSIHGRVLAFGAALALPLLTLSSWLAIELANSNTRLLTQTREALAAATSGRIDQAVQHTFGMLAGLAASRDLREGSVDEFQDYALALLRLPRIQSVWVYTPAGDVEASVGLRPPVEKFGTELHRLYSDVFRGRRAISHVVGDGIRTATVVAAVPLLGDAPVKLGIAAEVRVEPFSRVFDEAGMSRKWAAAVVDRHGTYVARSLDAARRVGQRSRPALVEIARRSQSRGVFDNVTYEGVHVANAYYRSELTGWTTVVAIPKSLLFKPFIWSLGWILLGGIAGFALIFLAARYAASGISEPVESLASYARALTTGQQPRSPRRQVSELEEVRRVLADEIVRCHNF